MGGFKVGLILAVSVALGLGIWFLTDSTLASYLVAIVTMAAAVAALFISSNPRKSIRSKISVKRSKNANATGVSIRRTNKEINSAIRLNRVEGGEITGVRED